MIWWILLKFKSYLSNAYASEINQRNIHQKIHRTNPWKVLPKIKTLLQPSHIATSQFPRPTCYWKWVEEPVYIATGSDQQQEDYGDDDNHKLGVIISLMRLRF